MFKRKKEIVNHFDLVKQDIFKTVSEIEIIENNMNYVTGKELDILVYQLNALRAQLSLLIEKSKNICDCA